MRASSAFKEGKWMPEGTTFEQLLTVSEVAETLRYTEGTVRHWIRNGKLSSHAGQLAGAIFGPSAQDFLSSPRASAST